MTIAKTIALANQHAANGNVPAACRILDLSIRASLSAKTAAQYAAAKQRILDAAVDANVARSREYAEAGK